MARDAARDAADASATSLADPSRAHADVFEREGSRAAAASPSAAHQLRLHEISHVEAAMSGLEAPTDSDVSSARRARDEEESGLVRSTPPCSPPSGSPAPSVSRAWWPSEAFGALHGARVTAPRVGSPSSSSGARRVWPSEVEA